MSETASQWLDAFAAWLASLPEDATALCTLLMADSIPERARRHVAGSLNYLCKSLDLIPDGIEDLGYLDDAFVLRVAAKNALEEAPQARQADIRGLLGRLADEAATIEKALPDEYSRFDAYVKAISKGAARGRTVDEIVSDPSVRSQIVREVQAWARGYQVPSLTRDEKTIIKLRSFLSTKLPP